MISKFRVWDKKRKKLGLLEADMISGEFQSGKICDDEDVDWMEIEEFILMQSTGLYDKNGKEIFEGDVIITGALGCIVGFGEYTYYLEDECTPTTEIGFYLSFLNVAPATYAPFDKYYWDNCEVIGNIYENELDLILYEAHKYNKLEDKNEE